ncbi:MAG TPA: hypothetical protein VEB60_00540 [Candidatus Paceibacterota bacterium]|nr:hypothetical protein [Candidatus Paceibacterota bacterium]
MFSTLQVGFASLALAANLGTAMPQTEIAEPPSSLDLTVEELIMKKSIEHGIDPKVPLSIAFCESTHRQFHDDGSVVRGKENSKDVGVFQINEKYHLEDSKKLGYDIYTMEGNIDYAMHLLESQGKKPWVWSKPCWDPKIS